MLEGSLLGNKQDQEHNTNSEDNDNSNDDASDGATRETTVNNTKGRIVSKSVFKVIVNHPHALAIITVVRVQLVQRNGEISAAGVLDSGGVNGEESVVVLDCIRRLQ